LDQLDSSGYYYKKSIALLEGTKDMYLLTTCYQNMGSLLMTQSKYDEAKSYILKGIAIREENNDKLGLTHSYIGISEVYMAQNDIAKAISYGQNAVELGKEIASPRRIAKASELLAFLYKRTGDYRKAQEMATQVETFQRQIFSIDKNKRAA